jgi:F-type H+-transporting ATPase subunit b
MVLSLLLCETFLKRSWHRAALVFAALITLGGLPGDIAEARSLGAQAAGDRAVAHAPTEGGRAIAAVQPAPTGAVEAPKPPTAAEAAGQGHAAPPPASAPDSHAEPSTGAVDAAHGEPTAHAPPAEGTHQTGSAAAGHGGQEAEHEESIWPTIARLFNFAVLVGGLIYFLRSPLAQHLASRSQQIRGGLVTARETSERASAQLAEIDRRLQALPRELEALRARGVEEIAAEERRIQLQAEAEKARLIAEMDRDVGLRVRLARQALSEHAADLAVTLAADRIKQTITDADQARLADRYASQVKDIHG